MTRVVFDNEDGYRVATKVETIPPDADWPTGGVLILVETGQMAEIDGHLSRREAEVLLHVLAHTLDFNLVSKRDERRMGRLQIAHGRRRRRPF